MSTETPRTDEVAKECESMNFAGCYCVSAPFARHLERSLTAAEAERDALTSVLRCHGFDRCDNPACNCGSWHQRRGWPERMREIADALDEAGHPLCNDNGNLQINALAELVAERDALRQAMSFAQGAIEDAIYTEDGLDGETGERVLHIMQEAVERGTFDQTQIGSLPRPMLETENDVLRARVAGLEAGLRAVLDLIQGSRGVAGLRLNGDEAPWKELRAGGQFEEWLFAFDDALLAPSSSECNCAPFDNVGGAHLASCPAASSEPQP